MKTSLKLCLLLTGIVLFSGGACPSNETTPSNKVAQTEIYQSYSIDDEGPNYEVTAFFRIGGKTGTTLALSAPSSVTLNGVAMKEHLNTTSGTYYSASIPRTTPSATFAFTDRNSKVYTNKIDLSRGTLGTAKLSVNGATAIAIPVSGTIPETANLSLDIDGRVVIVSSANGDMAEAYFDRAKNSIVILPAAWERTENGNVAINLDVRNAVPTQQGTALGGEMTFVYETPSVSATVAKARPTKKKPAANAAGSR
jgi:hypothetical protein